MTKGGNPEKKKNQIKKLRVQSKARAGIIYKSKALDVKIKKI